MTTQLKIDKVRLKYQAVRYLSCQKMSLVISFHLYLLLHSLYSVSSSEVNYDFKLSRISHVMCV